MNKNIKLTYRNLAEKDMSFKLCMPITPLAIEDLGVGLAAHVPDS
jgi:hypothetical protein